jgi:flagellar biogenesis protein FliO
MSVFGVPSKAPHGRPHRQPGFKWWVLILVLVIGFPLVLLQTVTPGGRYGIPSPSATEDRAGNQEPTATDTGRFLPEYQPDVIPALADAVPAAPTEAAEPAWLGMVDVVAKLALVLGLMYLLLIGLRWLQRGRRQGSDTGGATIRLLETVGLAPNRTLHLVSAGDKTLLIAATDYHVCLLTELPNVSLSAADDDPAGFEAILQCETRPPAESAEVTAVDWRVAVERLRSSAASVRQVLRKTDDAPEA